MAETSKADLDLVKRARVIHRKWTRDLAEAWGRAEVVAQQKGMTLELSASPAPHNHWVYLAVAYEHDATGLAALKYSYTSLNGAEALEGMLELLIADDSAAKPDAASLS